MRRFEPHCRAGFAWMTALFLAVTLPILAREGAAPLSRQRAVQTADRIARVVLPPMDAAAELVADAKAGRGTPLRYAKPISVEVAPATHGTWENVPEGRLWRLRFVSDGATDLNFGFAKFWLPEGATLHICSESEPYFQGPFTVRDNKPHGQLWTPVVPGGSACLELFVPTQATEKPQLVLASVNLGYRDMFRKRQELGRAQVGSCEVDVACPQAAGWSNEIRSAALYSLGGSAFCTGTLIANVAGDFRNYFLTASHCGITTSNGASVVVYWNFQSLSCGQFGGGSMAQNQSGAILRAARTDVDVALIELEDVPDSSFNVYYSGWDRSGVAPTGGVGIHHPNHDVKAISFSSTPLTNCSVSGGSTHWQVVWNDGVTEEGSSGSGLWNPNTHRLIGTLTGGDSSCASPNAPDCYGKFSVAWASGTNASSRLQDWLDPQNTGVTEAPGVDPGHGSILVPAGWSLLGEGCTPTNNAIDPAETVTVNIGLKNVGGKSTTNLIATLHAGSGVMLPSDPQDYGAVPGDGTVWRSFTFTADGNCGSTILPTLLLQEGTNQFDPLTFPLTLGQPLAVFSQAFDTVSAPTLPVGWTSSLLGNGNAWATSAAQRDSWPNAVFAANAAVTNDNRLTTPSINITSPTAQLTFRHRYITEVGYDGGVLEISINGGAFTDILTAGGSFVSRGYPQILHDTSENPLGGRPAWTGNSDGFVSTTANLPASAAGQSMRLRWRFGSDLSVGAVGWYVDNVVVFQGYQCCRTLVPPVIVDPHQVGTNVAFSYNSATGQSYIVESKLTVPDGVWMPFQTNVGDGTLLSYTNTSPGASQRVFRLRTE